LFSSCGGSAKSTLGSEKMPPKKAGLLAYLWWSEAPVFHRSVASNVALVGVDPVDQMPGAKQIRKGTFFSGKYAPAGLKNLNPGHGTCRILEPVSQLQQVALTPGSYIDGLKVGNICQKFPTSGRFSPKYFPLYTGAILNISHLKVGNF